MNGVDIAPESIASLSIGHTKGFDMAQRVPTFLAASFFRGGSCARGSIADWASIACLMWIVGLPRGVYAQSEGVQIRFKDRTQSSGIEFEHFSGRTGKHYIVETVTAGLVTFDYDDDGLIDVYLLNGAELQGKETDANHTNRLYRNLGNFMFRDVTDQAGAADFGFALGALAADLDNDGDQDLVIANFGSSVILENDGAGRFNRRMVSHGAKSRIGAGVVALDIENDGDLDLYTANYVDFRFDKEVDRTIFGVPAAPGPKDYLPDSDLLWENDGAGNWLDVSALSGVGQTAGPGMGVIAFDATGDGLSDVFVCNDSAANAFWENLGGGKFEENSLLAGLAYDVSGAQQATMGADAADWNQDGFIDIVTTNFMDEIPTLYENSGQGYFDDIGPAVGLGAADRSVTWGIGFGDFNNDTWPDLFVASGHLLSGVTNLNDSETFEAPNFVMQNEAGKRFRSVAASPSPVAKKQVSRGAAIDDFDNDGFLDVVILNLNDRIQLLENSTPANAQRFEVSLVGTTTSRDAVGARVTVALSDGKQLTAVVLRGRGYQSGFGHRLHFGIGDRSVAAVAVQWPGGRIQKVSSPEQASVLIVEENR